MWRHKIIRVPSASMRHACRRDTIILALLTVSPMRLFAAPQISVPSFDADGTVTVAAMAACLNGDPDTIVAADPNFLADGRLTFKGCALSRLLAVLPSDQSITILAQDQYAVTASAKYFLDNGAVLAHSVNGRPIAANRGGPIKMVLRDGNIPEAIAWYVKAIIARDTYARLVTVAVQGSVTGTLEPAAVVRLAGGRRMRLPAPHGARPETPDDVGGVEEAPVAPLARVLERFGDGAKSVTLEDLVGTKQVIDLRNDDALITCGTTTRPLTLARGGPCIVMPQSSSDGRPMPFFFLRTLTVD